MVGFSSFTLILTTECNLSCRYCYQTARKHIDTASDTLRAAVDFAIARGTENIRIHFTGGEPLLQWDSILESVGYAASRLPPDRKVDYEISTNGLLITDEIARFLDDHRFQVQLSFDGVASAQDYRQQASFDALDSLLDRLRRNTPDLFSRRLRISAIQTPATVRYLSESVRYFMEKGVCHLILFPAMRPWPEWKVGDVAALDDQFAGVYADSLRCLRETGTVPVALFRKHAGGRETREPCSAVAGSNLVIDVDGQAYGCVLFAESYREFSSDLLNQALAPLKLGDFRDSRLRQRHSDYLKTIADTALFRDLEERYSSYGRCAECSYSRACSVCPASIACDPANSDPHRVPDFICAYNRVSLKYRSLFPSLPDPLDLLMVTKRAGSANRAEPS